MRSTQKELKKNECCSNVNQINHLGLAQFTGNWNWLSIKIEEYLSFSLAAPPSGQMLTVLRGCWKWNNLEQLGWTFLITALDICFGWSWSFCTSEIGNGKKNVAWKHTQWTVHMRYYLIYIVVTVVNKRVRVELCVWGEEHGQLIWAGLKLSVSCLNAISGEMYVKRLLQLKGFSNKQENRLWEDEFLFIVRTLCPFFYTDSSWTSVIW